jgi:hypothetical protein
LPYRLSLVVTLVLIAGSGCSTDRTSPSEHQPTEQLESAQSQPSLSPAETVSAMIDAYLHQRLGEYYQYVSTRDKAVKSLDSLQAEFAPSAADLITDFLFSATKFTVDSTLVEGDSAWVFLTGSSPPVEFVIQNANIVERDLGPETDMSTKRSILAERYKLSGSPRVENPSVYALIREEKGWRVVIRWPEMMAQTH